MLKMLNGMTAERAPLKAIQRLEDLPPSFALQSPLLQQVVKKYPLKIPPYYLGLIRSEKDGIWNQCIPDAREITLQKGVQDPLQEARQSPVTGLTHRYPDRVLLRVSDICAMACRFCTRKRLAGDPAARLNAGHFRQALEYIRMHREVRDVLLSGGDPLMLPTKRLEYFIRSLRKITHIEIIRIGTRVPCVYPLRVDEALCDMLKQYHPLYINVHFNHPHEITPESSQACKMLADAGIPLGNQSVFLKGVNDDLDTMKTLVQKLLRIRVKPYYIYMPDIVAGTHHFRIKLKLGLKIMDGLRGWTTGMAVPHLVIDIEGGGGKIPLLPDYRVSKKGKTYVFRNYRGERFRYTDV